MDLSRLSELKDQLVSAETLGMTHFVRFTKRGIEPAPEGAEDAEDRAFPLPPGSRSVH